MADLDLQELRDRLADLLDPEADDEDAGRFVTIQPADATPVVKAKLSSAFKAEADLEAIGVKVGDELVGVAKRATILRNDIAGGAIGDGDGMTFPLGSSEFRLIEFTCTKKGCRSRAFASFYDERTNPKCGVHVDRPMKITVH
jgi:hypothetical protein